MEIITVGIERAGIKTLGELMQLLLITKASFIVNDFRNLVGDSKDWNHCYVAMPWFEATIEITASSDMEAIFIKDRIIGRFGKTVQLVQGQPEMKKHGLK